MARITVEDCLEHEPNRFSLVRLASRRAKQLFEGKPQVTERLGNKPIVTALQEIADGKVRFQRDEAAPENEDANGGSDIQVV
jgi:DNA-directed RNA polymerase subunit omega